MSAVSLPARPLAGDERQAGPRLALVLDAAVRLRHIGLADEEGRVGTFRLGRRSDGNRYNRRELGAVRELIPTSPTRYASRSTGTAANSLLQQQIEAMAARLAQLEGGSPKLA